MSKKSKKPQKPQKHKGSPELSRIISVADVLSMPKPMEISINPNPDELAALCKRFALSKLSMEAIVTLSPSGTGGDVLADISMKASLEQNCSITLEPLPEQIEASFSQVFSNSEESLQSDGFSENDEIVPQNAGPEDDLAEPIIDGKIDIGDFIAQELVALINPFPRKKDAVFEWVSEDREHKGSNKNPFAKLSSLKDSLADNVKTTKSKK